VFDGLLDSELGIPPNFRGHHGIHTSSAPGFSFEMSSEVSDAQHSEKIVFPQGRTAIKDLSFMNRVFPTVCCLLAFALNLTSVDALGTRSVAEFGAHGTGDDTDSIQQAIDFAVANPCRLVFPAPSYNCFKNSSDQESRENASLRANTRGAGS
jgi:polygalacturonase